MVTKFLSPFNNYPNCHISCYLHSDTKKRKAIIVFPGGGYCNLAPHEGEPVALRFKEEGYNTFVVTYSLRADAANATPLKEAALAVRYVRENAKAFHIDPVYVFVLGFSAGGHLAASIGTLWNSDDVKNALNLSDTQIAKPTATILCYPVITGGPYAHRGSIDALAGKPSENTVEAEKWSLEKHVTKDTAPAFIWHTANDTCVPIQNTLLYANALAENHILYEYHSFPKGRHGLGLCKNVSTNGDEEDIAYCSQWVEDAIRFLKTYF